MAKSRNRAKKKTRAAKTKQVIREGQYVTMSMPRPEANTRIEYLIIPEFPPENPKHNIPRTREGGKGSYFITFVLTVPGKDVFKDDLDLDKILESGHSLLTVPPEVTQLELKLFNEKEQAIIRFLCNKSKQISHAQIRVDALNFIDAERTAYDLIIPQLSYWSFLYDVPIDIAGYLAVEEQTETRKFNFGVIGEFKLLRNFDGFISFPTYRKFFAAYREGMNSTNVFYQALSFYKVIEGVIAERIREERRKKQGPIKYNNEQIPDIIDKILVSELTRDSFKPYLGKSFNAVKIELQDLIRNAIAHLSQLDGVLDPDKFDDVNTCLKVIPVLRYVAHQMLENDINSLAGSSTN